MVDSTPDTVSTEDTPTAVDTADAPTGQYYTDDRIAEIIRSAVAAGQASPSAPIGALAVPAAAEPEKWTVNEFLRNVVAYTLWRTEGEQRSAYAAVDAHFPAPDEETP